MQLVINSANIGTFFVKVTWDLMNRKVIWDTSGTTYNGSGAANVLGISFGLVDQTGVQLETINFAAPQIVGPVTSGNWIYETDLSSMSYGFIFQRYTITAAIQDAGGTIYTTTPVYKTICQPNDFSDQGYVPGIFEITPDCINSVLTVKELSLLVYANMQPISTSKTGVLSYPTGTIGPLNFANTPFTNNVVYTGQYRIVCTTIGVYSMSDDVYVNVSYVTNNIFDITCANKISDLMCCISEVQATAIKNCDNAIGKRANQQMYEVLPYLVAGLGKEISGQDAWLEAKQIRKILNCNCGSTSLSQSEFTPINPTVNSIVLVGVGGTSIPSPTTTGNTKTYNIQSSIYQIVKGNTGDLAFTISTVTTVANTVQYVLTFNYPVMAATLLTAIGASPTLLEQFNALVQAIGFSTVGLNGLCIIDLTKTNYSLSIAVNGSTLITNIVINGIIYAAPTNLFANNPTAVAAWLNSLTLGTFSATVTSGTLTILSVNNTNSVSTMTFTTPNVTQQFQATNATLTQILQALFNYICGMTALQVALGNNLSLCTFDYNGNLIPTTYTGTGPNPVSQGAYNQGVAAAICNLAARINTLTGITCAAIQAVFSNYPTAIFNNATDWFMSVVGGNCTKLTGRQAALGIIAAINANSDVKSAYCAIDCTTPGTCPDISGISAATVGANIGIYGVTFTNTPLANQTATVSYRVHGTIPFTVSTSALSLFPNGNINGTNPYQIPGLTAGTTYDVFIQNNCGGNGYTLQVTTPTGSVISGNYRLGSVLYNICGGSPSLLYSSVAFAPGTIMYYDSGLTTPVTGNSYIVTNTGEIYNLNPSTGVVGSDTSANCNNGTAVNVILGNNSATICPLSQSTLYTNGGFAVGKILYVDSALTTPQTGFSYVVFSGNIYNLNSGTGVIGALTGLTCTPTVIIKNATSGSQQIFELSGIVGYTLPAIVYAGNQSTGSHSSFSGAISVDLRNLTGTNNCISLIVNGSTVQSQIADVDGGYNFSTITVIATDNIEVLLATGIC